MTGLSKEDAYLMVGKDGIHENNQGNIKKAFPVEWSSK